MLIPARRLALAALALVFGLLVTGVAGAGAAPAAVVISNYAFGPAQMTINAGDTVTWTNNDSAKHDATSIGGPGPLKSPLLAKGQSYSLTFASPGTFRYTCTIHPDMLATITVKAAMTTTTAPAALVVPVTTAVAPPTKTPGSVTSVTQGAPSSTTPPAAPAPTEVVLGAVPTGVASAALSPDPARSRINPLLFLGAVVVAVAVGGTIMLVDRSTTTQVDRGNTAEGPRGQETDKP